MTTMYRASLGRIKAFEVLRTTEKQVVLPNLHRKGGEEREAKETEWYTWHETWEAAHARIVADAQKKVDILRRQLERANGELGNAKGMKPPNG
ncbi:hypothetical protein MASR1M8_16230 [Thermomonas brevis]